MRILVTGSADGLGRAPDGRAVALCAVALVVLGAASVATAGVKVSLGGRNEPSYNAPAWRDGVYRALE